jgi:hypothetical protein
MSCRSGAFSFTGIEINPNGSEDPLPCWYEHFPNAFSPISILNCFLSERFKSASCAILLPSGQPKEVRNVTTKIRAYNPDLSLPG